MPGRGSLKVTRALSRFLSYAFFREIAVQGADSIPAEGPLIYAVNHPNSLVDPLLIHAVLPRSPRFLAKHTLWDIPVVRPFLRLAGSIPVYRTQDKGARTAKNLEAFDACYRALAEGAVIGIFPEGVSHAGTSLKPIKTGIVRLVLGAEERHGPLGIRIVPVGLTFDARNLFRSRVLVTVGESIGPLEEVPADRARQRRVRDAMTARVEEALRKVTLNYGTAREARLLARAGDIYRSGTPPSLPGRQGMPELYSVRRQFAEGYDVMKEKMPERVSALARSVDAYDRMLRVTGFEDRQVVSCYRRGQVLRYGARMAARLLLYLPAGAAGILLNWIPYRLTDRIARPHGEQIQDPATYKILGGLFVFPAAWVLESLLAGMLLGWGAALALFLASLALAWAALRFKEDVESFWSESFGFFRLRARRRIWDELRKRREALAEEISEVAEDYLAGRFPDGGGSGLSPPR